jgi:hypothetical protein
MSAALQRLRRVARPGSLMVLFSDFFSLDEDSERHITQLRQHNDVIACQLWDGLELQAPPPGRYGLTDGQQSGVLDTQNTVLRSGYEQYFLDHHRRVQELMLRRAVPLLRLATHDDLVSSLKRGLATAGRGHAKGKAA